jgi:uncharacterized protein YbjT (DUF2867 family)
LEAAVSDVLVIGATGRQGGAVARELARAGKKVRPLTRDPGSSAARQLAVAGILGADSDLRDAGSLRHAVQGVDVVFAMTVMTDPPELEAEHGTAIVAATRSAGTPMLIYSSAALADTGTGIPSLEAKAQVERHVLAAHPGNVVLGPTGFFDMALRPESLAALADGTLVDGLPADLPIPGLALDDYGRMVNAIIDSPSLDNLPSRRLDLGCDTLTFAARAEALSDLLGRPVSYRPLPLPVVQSIDTYWYSLLQWMIRTKPKIDTGLPRRLWAGVGWQTFAEWAARQPWSELLSKAGVTDDRGRGEAARTPSSA